MSQPAGRSRYLGMDAYREHRPTPAPERSDSGPGRPPPGKVPITARLAPRTVVLRHGAGALSDMATKPLFIAGPRWPELAEKLGISERSLYRKLREIGDAPDAA